MIERHAGIQEWLVALGVLFAMFVASLLARLVLGKILSRGTNGRWNYVRKLAGPVSNLVYIIGLRLFIDVAPVGPQVAQWLGSALYVFAVLIVLGLVRKAAVVGIEWYAARGQYSTILMQGFVPLVRNAVTLFILFAGAIMILKRFNYDVMSLLTALGVGSLAVGLAAKDTLSNMISGFTLIIDRNLAPGDRVNLGGSIGDVDEIGLRSTRIRMGDGDTLIVPNSELVNTKIMNLSKASRAAACSAQVRVPYSAPFPRVREISLDVLTRIKEVEHSREKRVQLDSLADGYQQIGISFWVADSNDAGRALSDFNEQLLKALSEKNIPLVDTSIPVDPLPKR